MAQFDSGVVQFNDNIHKEPCTYTLAINIIMNTHNHKHYDNRKIELKSKQDRLPMQYSSPSDSGSSWTINPWLPQFICYILKWIGSVGS